MFVVLRRHHPGPPTSHQPRLPATGAARRAQHGRPYQPPLPPDRLLIRDTAKRTPGAGTSAAWRPASGHASGNSLTSPTFAVYVDHTGHRRL